MGKRRLKPLLPSLRERKRYLAYEVISKAPIDSESSEQAIVNAAYGFLGSSGTSKAGIIPMREKWNSNRQRGILRVNNKNVDKVRASFVLIQKINGIDAVVRSIGASGILRKAINRYLHTAS
jgi:ribonuclease P/MRP protein subunit POP5